MKRYRVRIPEPLTSNHLYATGKSGHRFLSSEGKEYRGEWRDLPLRKSIKDVKADYLAGRPHLKNVMFSVKEGQIFIEGSVGRIFRNAGIPKFKPGTKVVIRAFATWPDRKKRDMSNFQKPIEDAFQDGGHIQNDSHLLWRNIDFRIVPGKFFLDLVIFASEGEEKWGS